MQKYTRSSRSTTRGSSIDTEEVSAGDAVRPAVSSSSSSSIPEPIRRWHSFHSRRSSFGHSAAPHLPIVTGAVAPPVTKPASRFLSPPPLTPRRRFSVWYNIVSLFLYTLARPWIRPSISWIDTESFPSFISVFFSWFYFSTLSLSLFFIRRHRRCCQPGRFFLLSKWFFLKFSLLFWPSFFPSYQSLLIIIVKAKGERKREPKMRDCVGGIAKGAGLGVRDDNRLVRHRNWNSR